MTNNFLSLPGQECHLSALEGILYIKTLKLILCRQKDFFFILLSLGLGTHLFVKVPRPGDSEVTFSVFESSCHLLLPV